MVCYNPSKQEMWVILYYTPIFVARAFSAFLASAFSAILALEFGGFLLDSSHYVLFILH